MGPFGDVVLRRDWHTMSLAGRQSAGLAEGLVVVIVDGLMEELLPHLHLRGGSLLVPRGKSDGAGVC